MLSLTWKIDPYRVPIGWECIAHLQNNIIWNIIAFDVHEGDYHVRFSFCADLSPRVEDRNGLRYINDKIIRPQRGRTVFSAKQLHELEKVFVNDQYISGQQRRRLSSQLGLTETQVRVWFQNRRIKWRKQKLERKVKAWTGNSLRISLGIIPKGALILYSVFWNKDYLLINSSVKIILSSVLTKKVHSLVNLNINLLIKNYLIFFRNYHQTQCLMKM